MRRTSFLLACAMLVGCGAIEEAPPASGSSGGGAPSTPSSPTTPATPTTPQGPTRQGSVSVHTFDDRAGDGTSPIFGIYASAFFGPKEEGEPLAEGCRLLGDRFADATPEPPGDSAGTVDLEVVLAEEKSSLKLEFDPTRKQYDSLSANAEGPATGTIRVRARGGAVPGFEANVSALPPTEIVSPTPGSAIGARDLPVSWTFAGAERHSIVYFSTLTADVQCYVAKGRELVIPAALVSKVLESKGDLRLWIMTAGTTWVDSGDYRISVSHNMSARAALARE